MQACRARVAGMSRARLCTAGLTLLLACGLVLHPAWGATDDLAGVGRILGDGSAALPGMAQFDGSEKVLDQLALEATRGLGKGNPYWKASNPQWTKVYQRVRAELGSEQTQIFSDLDKARQTAQTRLVAATAAELSAADLKTVLAYYETPEGRRFEAFMGRVDGITASALLGPPPNSAADPPPPTPVQMRDYVQMLLLWRVMQAGIAAQATAAAAHGDTSGFSGLGIMLGLAIRSHPAEVAALFAEYQSDLPQFAAFEKTAAAQQLYHAMGDAIFLAKPPLSQPMSDAFTAVELRHEKDWQALYQAETGR
jgi:hypothetical protein